MERWLERKPQTCGTYLAADRSKVAEETASPRQAGLNDCICFRLRVERKGHVWAYDFVLTRMHKGQPLLLLLVVDEWTCDGLLLDVARPLGSDDVLDRLSWLMATCGAPDHVRSDNGSDFAATTVRERLGKVGVKRIYIEPDRPWENGYVDSLNGMLRDELLNGEAFYTVAGARVLIEGGREHFNRVRPHNALGYRPPAPEVTAGGPPSVALRAVQQRLFIETTTAWTQQ